MVVMTTSIIAEIGLMSMPRSMLNVSLMGSQVRLYGITSANMPSALRPAKK